MNLLTDTQMDGLSQVEKAKKAINHVLIVLRDNPDAYYHLGLGTQAFALLTEAAADLNGRTVEETRNAVIGS